MYVTILMVAFINKKLEVDRNLCHGYTGIIVDQVIPVPVLIHFTGTDTGIRNRYHYQI